MRKLGHGQSRCITRPWLGARRSSLEVHVGACVYGCVQMSPFVKPPDPLGTREQAAALSEKQDEPPVHCHSKRNAKRGPTTPWHGMHSLRSPWRICDSQHNIGHDVQTVLGPGSEASGLAKRDHQRFAGGRRRVTSPSPHARQKLSSGSSTSFPSPGRTRRCLLDFPLVREVP